jgi:hypothetical protein
MQEAYAIRKRHVTKRIMIAAIVVLITFTFILRGSADSPVDPKRVAFDAIDRNADQIALVGDVIYYFGEPGMQEYESSKFLKATWSRSDSR